MENLSKIRKHLVEQCPYLAGGGRRSSEHCFWTENQQSSGEDPPRRCHNNWPDVFLAWGEAVPRARPSQHFETAWSMLGNRPISSSTGAMPKCKLLYFYIFFMAFFGSEWIAAFIIHISKFYSVLGNTFFHSALHRVCSMLEVFFLVYHFQYVVGMPSCFSMSCVIYFAIYYLFTLLTL